MGAPGDGVLINTPVYGPFLTAPVNQGRVLHKRPARLHRQRPGTLLHAGHGGHGCGVQPNTRLFLLCNPHNPVGRAYTRAELQEIADLCARTIW
jgi:cystathionine beta-lyase